MPTFLIYGVMATALRRIPCSEEEQAQQAEQDQQGQQAKDGSFVFGDGEGHG